MAGTSWRLGCYAPTPDQKNAANTMRPDLKSQTIALVREVQALPYVWPALPEVHECLPVITPWAGPIRVDVTWDPPLIARGLPGTLGWDGESDMMLAVGETGPGWAVPQAGLREAKEALRSRLYGPGERELRDRTLAALAKHFELSRESAVL